jgi:hypothetical protein
LKAAGGFRRAHANPCRAIEGRESIGRNVPDLNQKSPDKPGI